MRGFYSILPTLSPDFSGVCSTLFELGGILAIHDRVDAQALTLVMMNLDGLTSAAGCLHLI